MTEHRVITPDFSKWASWPERLAEFRTTDWLDACLVSIRDEAGRAEDLETYWAAQYAIDNGGDLAELDAVFDAYAEEERRQSIAYRYETRTGREWPGDCYFDLLNKGLRGFAREAR